MSISKANNKKKTFTAEGVFKGADDRLYLFKDKEDENLEFQLCMDHVLSKFDLNGTKEIDQYFTITYILNEDDEHEEVELEIIDLKRNTSK